MSEGPVLTPKQIRQAFTVLLPRFSAQENTSNPHPKFWKQRFLLAIIEGTTAFMAVNGGDFGRLNFPVQNTFLTALDLGHGADKGGRNVEQRPESITF